MGINVSMEQCIHQARIIYESAASLSGLRLEEGSRQGLDWLVEAKYGLVDEARRPEATASLLRVVAMALQQAQDANEVSLHENSIPTAKDAVCPVYPFG